MAQYHRNKITVLSIYPSHLSSPYSLDSHFRRKFRELRASTR